MTAACEVWLARDFLHRLAARRRAVVVSETQMREPDGHVLALPTPCSHDPLDCPPHVLAVSQAVAA